MCHYLIWKVLSSIKTSWSWNLVQQVLIDFHIRPKLMHINLKRQWLFNEVKSLNWKHSNLFIGKWCVNMGFFYFFTSEEKPMLLPLAFALWLSKILLLLSSTHCTTDHKLQSQDVEQSNVCEAAQWNRKIFVLSCLCPRFWVQHAAPHFTNVIYFHKQRCSSIKNTRLSRCRPCLPTLRQKK